MRRIENIGVEGVEGVEGIESVTGVEGIEGIEGRNGHNQMALRQFLYFCNVNRYKRDGDKGSILWCAGREGRMQ